MADVSCIGDYRNRISVLESIESDHKKALKEIKVLQLSVEALKSECNEKEEERCILEAQNIETEIALKQVWNLW